MNLKKKKVDDPQLQDGVTHKDIVRWFKNAIYCSTITDTSGAESLENNDSDHDPSYVSETDNKFVSISWQ